MGTDIEIDLSKDTIILFDGVCNLCNASVNFIIDRDPESYFKFASLQQVGEIEELKAYEGEAQGLSSIMLIDRGRVYKQSAAALRVARCMSGLWSMLYAFIIVPPFIRDWVYDIIAKNRYRWFGSQESCRVPEPHLRDRFLV